MTFSITYPPYFVEQLIHTATPCSTGTRCFMFLSIRKTSLFKSISFMIIGLSSLLSSLTVTLNHPVPSEYWILT